MENLGKGPGNVAVDGAFERFLTAAIATIITIMFSWRLLAEENENFGDMSPGATGRTPMINNDGGPKRTGEGRGNDGNSEIIRSKTDTLGTVCETEQDISQCEVVEGENPPGEDLSCQPKSPEGDDDEGLDYQSSWADYDPDEDMYGSVHTRRSAKDFISSSREPKKERNSFSDSDAEVTEAIVPSSHELLEQLYVNKEYSSIVESEGYVDLNNKIDDSSSESESESEEGDFEPPMIDSDEEQYYPTVLEPIIEEDSDDSMNVETELSDDKTVKSVEIESSSLEPHFISPESVIEVCQGGMCMSKSGSDVTNEPDELTHVDLFTPESMNNTQGMKEENETSEYNFESKEKTKPAPIEISKFENENFEKIEMDDSLPASPIRTCAIDDDKDGYFSDESCSSESVVTVVSLRSYERNKMNEIVCLDSHDLPCNETSIKHEELVETCAPSEENINNTGQRPDQIKEDIIAFIHGIENRLPNQSADQNPGSSNLNANVDTDVIDQHDSGLNTLKNVTEPPVICDNHKNQVTCDHLQNLPATAVDNISKNVGITYNDFVNELEATSESVQKSESSSVELGHSDSSVVSDLETAETENPEINGDILEDDEDPSPSPLDKSLENIEISEELLNNHADHSPIDQESDEEPREYNPDEDDFAQFHSDLDSDEDSFYLLIGGNDNLRKLQTFTNLDVVGLSPGDESSYVDEFEKKIVFSRTEEVVTEHSVNVYVKDRDIPDIAEVETQIENEKNELINEQDIKFNKSFEEEQKEILDNLEHLLDSDSESESVQDIPNEQEESEQNIPNEQVNSELLNGNIDQLGNVDKIKSDINSYDQISKISDIKLSSVDIDHIKYQTLPGDVCQQTLVCNEAVLEGESRISQDLKIKDFPEGIVKYPIISEQTEKLISLDAVNENIPEENFKNAALTEQKINQTGISLLRDLDENGVGFANEQRVEIIKEQKSKDISCNNEILYSENQISESLNNNYETEGVLDNDTEQRLTPLIEFEPTDSGKSKFSDSKINGHEPLLTNSGHLNPVVQNNIDGSTFTGINSYSNEDTLPNGESVEYKSESDTGENDLEKLYIEEVEVIPASATKSNNGLGIDSLENADNLTENLQTSNKSDSVSKDSSIIVELEKSIQPCIEILSNAVQTEKTNTSVDTEKNLKSGSQLSQSQEKEITESSETNHTGKELQNGTGNVKNVPSSPSLSRVVHTSVQRPSGYKGVRGKIVKQLQYKPKQYSSVLQQPIIVETHRSEYVDSPEKGVPKFRQKILVSRKRFLSEENLSTLPNNFRDQFSQHKSSLTKSLPRQRRYVRRDESSVQARKNLSYDRIDRLRELCTSPRLSDDSFEKPEIDHLHADCIFSPKKHEEIMNTTLSIDNLQAHLLRYGSVASLVETDIDSGETFETRIFPETNIDDFELQVPLQRSQSMSDIAIKRRNERRGRFADRNVPKSKSLQTLETNIDDVFTAEGQGNLTRVPSVHELRVSKSLSKLNVPDWYKNSSVSRSGSTFSLYSSRRDSTSTTSSFGYPPSLTSSPCPGSNAVVIKTRVTPSSAKLIRAPKLPMTPEKSPIPPTPIKLPSDKFRKKEKAKELMPIPIMPFAKLRLMFESRSSKQQSKSSKSSSSSAPKSPTSPEVSPPSLLVPSTAKDSIKQDKQIVPQNQNTTSLSPTSSTDSRIKYEESVNNGRIANNVAGHKPPIPEKPKTLPTNKAPQHSKELSPQENSPKHVRYSIPSQSLKSPVQNEQVKRLAPPPRTIDIAQSQSRKGKVYDFNDNITSQSRAHEYVNLQGELLFDFLQKLRYSRLQENVFTDQLPSDNGTEDNGQHYRFPILSVNQHSPGFDESRDHVIDTGNLQVVFADTALNGGNDDANLNETSLEEVLSGLLALNEKKKSLSKSEDDLVSRKISEESQASLSPPWWLGPIYTSVSSDSDRSPTVDALNYYDNVFDEEIRVRCKNCRRESPLQSAKLTYKTCHHCYTYYCCRHCRQVDWEKHKRKCLLSRINSLCKRVIKLVNRDSDTQYHFSRAARRGYLSQGRGCLILAFSDLECAENFLVQGVHSLWLPPVFLSVNNLHEAHMLQDSVQSLVEMCTGFNPELKYVLHVVIPSPGNLPQKPMPRKYLPLVQKTAKLRLSPAHMHPELKESEESSTLILTAVPGGPDVNSNSERKSREVCFVNIQRKLRERGVSLRHHYPNVYDKLIEYVADAKHFSPLIIYPYDNRIRKRFMCVIMPESEPEIEWVQERTLLDELDITDFCREGVFSLSISSLEDIPETPV